MTGPVRSRRSLAATLTSVAFYVLVLLMAPSLHHDFACHQNSRTHCTSCLTSQTAPNVDICHAPVDAMDALAGQVEARASDILQTPALISDSGRSPPA
jgi:hypothetical protein